MNVKLYGQDKINVTWMDKIRGKIRSTSVSEELDLAK